MQDYLCVLRIVLVPAIVDRLARPGERHGRDETRLESGIKQAPCNGAVVVAGCFEAGNHWALK